MAEETVMTEEMRLRFGDMLRRWREVDVPLIVTAPVAFDADLAARRGRAGGGTQSGADILRKARADEEACRADFKEVADFAVRSSSVSVVVAEEMLTAALVVLRERMPDQFRGWSDNLVKAMALMAYRAMEGARDETDDR